MKGKSKRTIEKTIKQAVKQSHYIIVDLRRIQISESQSLAQLEKEFKLRMYIKRMLVITKRRELKEFSR